MQKLSTLVILIMASSCGSSTQNQDSLTIEEENAIADSITTQLQDEQQELSDATEESLSEIDSLLENL